jgi:hypothetical protein
VTKSIRPPQLPNRSRRHDDRHRVPENGIPIGCPASRLASGARVTEIFSIGNRRVSAAAQFPYGQTTWMPGEGANRYLQMARPDCSSDRQVYPPTTKTSPPRRNALFALGAAAEKTFTDQGHTGTNRARPGLGEALAASTDDRAIKRGGEAAALIHKISSFTPESTPERPWREIPLSIPDPKHPRAPVFPGRYTRCPIQRPPR